MLNSLGEGWLGKVLVALVTLILGGLSGWAARRPLEKAGVLEAVNKRLDMHMGHLEKEVERLTRADETCRARIATQDARIDQLEGELRQEKQVMASMVKVQEEQR